MGGTPIITAAPCAKCPFRKDVPIYLTAGRRQEIARALVEGSDFHCHNTVDYDTDELDDDGFDVPSTDNASLCSGAMTALDVSGGSNQNLRIAMRLGLYDPAVSADHADKVWRLDEWVRLAEGATGDEPDEVEEGDCCAIVNENCEAPAGFMGSNGGIVVGTDYVDTYCSGCGDPVCDSCLAIPAPYPMCPYCAEEE